MSSATPITDEVRASIEQEVKQEYEARFIKEITVFKTNLEAENSAAIKKAIDDWKREQEPPKPEELRTLLMQEYVEFSVDVPWDDPPKDSPIERTEKRTFRIRELPQSAEKAFYRKFKEDLIPHAKEVAELTFNLLDGDTAEKFISVLNAFEPTFDLMAAGVVMVLDPKGKEKLNIEWVQANISSYRQWNILTAQVEVNRLRDFLLQVSRSSRGNLMSRAQGTQS